MACDCVLEDLVYCLCCLLVGVGLADSLIGGGVGEDEEEMEIDVRASGEAGGAGLVDLV